MSNDNIMPSLDELKNAVNSDMEASDSRKKISEAEISNPFDASKWFLQTYPVVKKPEPKPKPKPNPKPNPIPPGPKPIIKPIDSSGGGYYTPPIIPPPQKKSSAGKWIVSILVIIALVLGLIFIPFNIETANFNANVNNVRSVAQMEELVKFISVNHNYDDTYSLSTRDILNKYGDPNEAKLFCSFEGEPYYGRIDYELYYATLDDETEISIFFDYAGNVQRCILFKTIDGYTDIQDIF